jgi:hypothetical protein
MKYVPEQDFGLYFAQPDPIRYTANIDFALPIGANNAEGG